MSKLRKPGETSNQHIVGSVKKNWRYFNTVSLSEYQGRRRLDIRETTKNENGRIIFTGKGITAQCCDIPALLRLIAEAQICAQSLGWIGSDE